MSLKLILSFLKVSVTILFYFLLIITLVVFITSVINIADKTASQKKFSNKIYDYEVKSFEPNKTAALVTYSSDSLIRYEQVKDRFIVQIEPRSAMGYYALVMKLIFMTLGISILWNLKKIFKQTNLQNPFNNTITKRIKTLAVLFIISDFFKFIDYLLFNSFLHKSVSAPALQLITNIGDGIITGMILLIVAVIFERGIALQEENALMV